MASIRTPTALRPVPSRPTGGARRTSVGQIGLFLLGALVALGQLEGGFYDVDRWGVATIVAAVVLIALLVSRPWRPDAPGVLLLGSVIAFALLSALSILWAESSPQAVVEAHRWALYAMVVAIGLWAMPSARTRRAFLLGVGLASAAVVLVLAVTLATGGGQGLFLVMRLTNPLGYVNGQAAALLMTLWPAVAAAERWRSPSRRGLAAGIAVLALGLLVLTQSRGGIIALVASAVVVLGLVPGRLRRAYLLTTVAVALAIAIRPLNAIYSSPSAEPGRPASDALSHGGLVLLACAVGAGIVWGLATWLLDARGRTRIATARRGASGLLVAGVVVAAVVGVAVLGNPIDRVSTQVDQFTSLNSAVPAQDRLLAGTSNRYDYWRVAWEEFGDAPIAGLGAGNYTQDYFRLRGTEEDVRQPHSLELQALSELGLLGIAVIVALLGALGWAAAGASRRAARGTEEIGPVVAAVGIVTAWAAQTSVDWMHLLPSLTAVALLAATTLVRGRQAGVADRFRLPVTIVAILLAVVAAAGAGRLVLADRALSRSSDVLATDPVGAIEQANRSLDLQGGQLQALYLRAAGLARVNDYEAARATLLEGVRLEPSAFLPHALLGDLATRRGDLPVAIAEYQAALALNPRNQVLRDDLTRLGAAPATPLPATP